MVNLLSQIQIRLLIYMLRNASVNCVDELAFQCEKLTKQISDGKFRIETDFLHFRCGEAN